jgi:hypothetical protein
MGMNCIYIAGYGRSGSTIVDLMISNRSGYRSIGEASNLFDWALAGGACACGAPITNCEYWKKFLVGKDWRRLAKDQRAAEGVFGWWRRRTVGLYNSFWREVLMDADSRGETIVDSSKINRVTCFRPANLRRQGAHLTIVHMYREPEDLLSSLIKGSNRRIESGSEELQVNIGFLLRSWFGAFFGNLMTVFVGRFVADKYQFLKLRELADNPENISEILGGGFANSNEGIDLDNGHAIAGNRLRRMGGPIDFEPERVTQQYDLDVPWLILRLFMVLRVFDRGHSA